MSWSHCSELGLIAAAILLVSTAAVAGAVSVTWENVPEEAEAGEEVTLEIELSELYAEDSRWEVSGTTGLENAEWTVEFFEDGQEVESFNDTGGSLAPVLIDENESQAPAYVYVVVTGEVPEPDAYDYQNGQQFQALDLDGAAERGEFEIDTWEIPHHTAESQSARSSLGDARSAVDQADSDGADVSGAESTWDDAVAAFESGDFDQAVSLAEDAESQAQSAESGSGDGSGDDGSTDGADDGAGNETATDDTTTDDGAADGDGDQQSDDGASASDAPSDDDGGIGFVTVLFYVLGAAVLLGVGAGGFYLVQQNKGPSRDPLG